MKPSTEKLFNSIYTKWRERCLAFAKSYLHDTETAGDVVSDVMIQLWQKIINEEEIENYGAYLFTLVKNECLNVLRRKERALIANQVLGSAAQRELELRISSLQSFDPEYIFSNEILLIYHRTLESLPAQTRKIFLLSRQEGLPGKKIASLCGLSVKGVDYHIARALKSLRLALQDYLPFLVLLTFVK